jgi:putative redox protein
MGEARKRLLEIADKCPVHRTLTSEIDIRTSEESAQRPAR